MLEAMSRRVDAERGYNECGMKEVVHARVDGGKVNRGYCCTIGY
jgi:hypothetical protein